MRSRLAKSEEATPPPKTVPNAFFSLTFTPASSRSLPFALLRLYRSVQQYLTPSRTTSPFTTKGDRPLPIGNAF